MRTIAWGLAGVSASYLILATFKPSVVDFSLGSGALTFIVKTQLRYSCFFAMGIWMWFLSLGKFKVIDLAGLGLAIFASVLEVQMRAEGTRLLSGLPTSDVVPHIVWVASLAFMFTVTRFPDRFSPSSPRAQRVSKHIGQMTYPLYLVHAVFGAFLIRMMVEAGIDRWIALSATVSLMVLLSFTIARLAEPTLRNWLNGLLARAEIFFRSIPTFGFLFRPGGTIAA